MKKATAAELCAKWMQENECKTYRDLEAITKTVSLSIMSCPLIRPRSAIYCMIGVLLATGGTPQGLGLMASLLGSSLWWLQRMQETRPPFIPQRLAWKARPNPISPWSSYADSTRSAGTRRRCRHWDVIKDTFGAGWRGCKPAD